MSNEAKETEWITTQQAAEIMQIERHTVAEYCRRGTITCMKFGRDWMVARQEAEEFKRTQRGRPRKED